MVELLDRGARPSALRVAEVAPADRALLHTGALLLLLVFRATYLPLREMLEALRRRDGYLRRKRKRMMRRHEASGGEEGVGNGK